MMDAFVEAGGRPGSPRNEDFNGAAQDGVGHYQLTQRDGQRCSAAVAYLHPAMDRPNLTVETDIQVAARRVRGQRAVGVEGAAPRRAAALRADARGDPRGGAYNSPQLLMLSGIGPAEHLALRLIEPLLDRPLVGQNLQDHVERLGALALARAGQPR